MVARKRANVDEIDVSAIASDVSRHIMEYVMLLIATFAWS